MKRIIDKSYLPKAWVPTNTGQSKEDVPILEGVDVQRGTGNWQKLWIVMHVMHGWRPSDPRSMNMLT